MKNTKLSIVILLTVTFLAFLPALKNGFVNWDDEYYVLHNELVREHSVSNTVKIFAERYFSDYLPLTMLSYNLEHAVFGYNPFIYHFDNLLLHLLNCLLVFYFIFLLCGNNRVAFLVALLFGIHPMHVESVAWISERKDVLYAFFYLCALLMHLKYIKSGKKRYITGTYLVFILACLSKAMAMTLPFVMLLIDYYCERRPWKNNLKEKAGLIFIALVFAGLGFLTQQKNGAVQLARITDIGTNIFHALYNTGLYLYKFLLPINLSNSYSYPLVKIAMLPLVAVTIAAIILVFYRPTKIKIFGSVFFALTIIPVLQFLPFGMGNPAERYTYLPYIGMSYLTAEYFEKRIKRFETGPGRSKVWKLVLAVLFACFFLLTIERVGIWKDSRTLWKDAISKDGNSPIAIYNIAQFSAEDGDYETAIKGFSRTIEFEPKNTYPLRERAKAYINTGDFALARADIQTINGIDKDLSIVTKELMDMCERMERKGKKGIGRKAAILTEEARTLFSQGDIKAAISKYTEVLKMNPEDSESYSNRGIAYNLIGESEKALDDLTNAINKQDRIVSEYYFNRGNIYRNLKKMTEALADYNIAIAKEKGKSEYYNNRGICNYLLKNNEKALADFDMALKLNPANKSAGKNRGILLYSAGK